MFPFNLVQEISIFTTQREFDDAVRDVVQQGGFTEVSITRTMGIPDHVLEIVKGEFTQAMGSNAPQKYQESCPYYQVHTEKGTFRVAWVAPELAVLDLKGVKTEHMPKDAQKVPDVYIFNVETVSHLFKGL